MIKTLIANMHYPDRYHMWAPYNRAANLAIAGTGAVDPEIVAPRPYALPLRCLPYHHMCSLPAKERGAEGLVHYPRFLYALPKRLFYGATFDFYRHSVGRYVGRNIGRKDVVHAHHVFLDGYGMIGTCRRWGVPLVVDVHGDSIFTGMVRDPLIGRKMVETLDVASKIVCISQNLYRMARGFGLDEDKLEYVPLGVDVDEFRPGDREGLKKGFGLQGKTVVLYVGQLIERKGVGYLIQALARIDRPLLRRCQVVIAGDGRERERLERLARELEVDGYVSFVGKVSQADLRRWYAAADVFVLPSLSEGRPTVVNEAMASGCAVVASDVSGIPEQVDDGCTGFLVAPADPAALAEKIGYLIGNESEAAAMGRNGRKKILDEKLTWEGYADRVVKIYGGLAGRTIGVRP